MQLDWDQFVAMQGAAFRVGSEGPFVELVLESVEPLAQSHREGGSFRLGFRGPLEPALQQGLHRFAAGEEAFDIFIVPVGRDSAGIIYEAVFN
jgi:hypothetical protein